MGLPSKQHAGCRSEKELVHALHLFRISQCVGTGYLGQASSAGPTAAYYLPNTGPIRPDLYVAVAAAERWAARPATARACSCYLPT